MKNYTDLNFCIDRSGSMSNIARDMEGGFATFIEEQKKSGDDIKVSVVYFDSQYEVGFTELDVKDVQKIEIIPRGSTALFDAIGRTINAVGKRLSDLNEDDRPNRVLIHIITDGQENASKEFSLAQIKEMIKTQRETYAWDFVFLGANIDSFAVGGSMGVVGSSTCNYSADSKGVAEAWNSSARGFDAYKKLDRTVDRVSTYSFDDAK